MMTKRIYLLLIVLITFAKVSHSSGLALIDHEQIKQVKARLNHDAKQSAHWQSFMSAVEKDLDMQALSVTLSAPLLPDGDNKDYYSVGPYWWPNPDTKDGLPWIKRDGERNYQFRGEYSDNRMFFTLASATFRLSLAYYLTGEQQYADKTKQLLSHWFINPNTAMNPNLDFGQGVPGKTNGRPYGIIEFRHLLLILDSATLIKPVVGDKFNQQLNVWVKSFLNWLTTSKIGVEQSGKYNNHGSYYDALVAGIHVYLHQPEQAKQVFETTKKRIVGQISAQGLQAHELERTRPYHYSAFNLLAFTQIAFMAENLGVDLWHYPSKQDPRILTAFNYLLDNADKPSLWQGKSEKTVNLRHMVVPALRINRFAPVKLENISAHQSSHQEMTMCQLLFNYSAAPLNNANNSPFACTL